MNYNLYEYHVNNQAVFIVPLWMVLVGLAYLYLSMLAIDYGSSEAYSLEKINEKTDRILELLLWNKQ
jgi:ABC-type Na+ efflux pump permease subunit